jgi:hypothetical protein
MVAHTHNHSSQESEARRPQVTWAAYHTQNIHTHTTKTAKEETQLLSLRDTIVSVGNLKRIYKSTASIE